MKGQTVPPADRALASVEGWVRLPTRADTLEGSQAGVTYPKRAVDRIGDGSVSVSVAAGAG